MPTLYVTQPGAVVRHAHGRLLVELGGKTVLCALAREVEGAVVFGAVQVTTAALCAIWQGGGNVAFVSSHGRLRGRATAGEGRNAERRIRQFELHRDGDFRLDFARRVAAAKIGNGRAVLCRLARNGHGDELRESAKCLKDAARKAQQAGDVAALRGIEGSAAVRYFAALRLVLPDELEFANVRDGPRPMPSMRCSIWATRWRAMNCGRRSKAVASIRIWASFTPKNWGAPRLRSTCSKSFARP